MTIREHLRLEKSKYAASQLISSLFNKIGRIFISPTCRELPIFGDKSKQNPLLALAAHDE